MLSVTGLSVSFPSDTSLKPRHGHSDQAVIPPDDEKRKRGLKEIAPEEVILQFEAQGATLCWD